MDAKLWCQSCGLPLVKPEEFGTDAAGNPNEEYCIYCYKDGAFTQDLTLDQMIGINLQFLDQWNKDSAKQWTKEEAREELRKMMPRLKRWAGQ